MLWLLNKTLLITYTKDHYLADTKVSGQLGYVRKEKFYILLIVFLWATKHAFHISFQLIQNIAMSVLKLKISVTAKQIRLYFSGTVFDACKTILTLLFNETVFFFI